MLSTSGMHDAVWLETSLFVLDDFQSYYVDRDIKKKYRQDESKGIYTWWLVWDLGVLKNIFPFKKKKKTPSFSAAVQIPQTKTYD